jgi:hypothetical protein
MNRIEFIDDFLITVSITKIKEFSIQSSEIQNVSRLQINKNNLVDRSK